MDALYFRVSSDRQTTESYDQTVLRWLRNRKRENGPDGFIGFALLGLYRAGQLTFIGSVGSGFTQESQAAILSRLTKLETASCPFPEAPRRSEPAHWVRPELMARVRYAEWTPEQRLRQPVFLELRDDVG